MYRWYYNPADSHEIYSFSSWFPGKTLLWFWWSETAIVLDLASQSGVGPSSQGLLRFFWVHKPLTLHTSWYMLASPVVNF